MAKAAQSDELRAAFQKHEHETAEHVARLEKVFAEMDETPRGKTRDAMERCHHSLAQFGRVARRLDRSGRRFLGRVQLAACIILIRSGFVR